MDNCPSCGADVSSGGKVGVEVPGVYDGILFWMCAFCDACWHRHHDLGMQVKAEPFMRERSR